MQLSMISEKHQNTQESSRFISLCIEIFDNNEKTKKKSIFVH